MQRPRSAAQTAVAAAIVVFPTPSLARIQHQPHARTISRRGRHLSYSPDSRRAEWAPRAARRATCRMRREASSDGGIAGTRASCNVPACSTSSRSTGSSSRRRDTRRPPNRLSSCLLRRPWSRLCGPPIRRDPSRDFSSFLISIAHLDPLRSTHLRLLFARFTSCCRSRPSHRFLLPIMARMALMARMGSHGSHDSPWLSWLSWLGHGSHGSHGSDAPRHSRSPSADPCAGERELPSPEVKRGHVTHPVTAKCLARRTTGPLHGVALAMSGPSESLRSGRSRSRPVSGRGPANAALQSLT